MSRRYEQYYSRVFVGAQPDDGMRLRQLVAVNRGLLVLVMHPTFDSPEMKRMKSYANLGLHTERMLQYCAGKAVVAFEQYPETHMEKCTTFFAQRDVHPLLVPTRLNMALPKWGISNIGFSGLMRFFRDELHAQQIDVIGRLITLPSNGVRPGKCVGHLWENMRYEAKSLTKNPPIVRPLNPLLCFGEHYIDYGL